MAFNPPPLDQSIMLDFSSLELSENNSDILALENETKTEKSKTDTEYDVTNITFHSHSARETS